MNNIQRNKENIIQEIQGLCLVLPVVLFLGFAILYPISKVVQDIVLPHYNSAELFEVFHNTWLWQAAKFTLWQASMSAIITILIAILLGKIFATKQFLGKKILLALSSLPFALPSIIVAFSFVIMYGKSGYLGALVAGSGIETPLIYNRWAIVAAHVFFNLPFTAKLLSQHYMHIPQHYYKIANLINLSKWQIFLYIELPHLKKVAFNTGVLVFSMCLSSFAIAMVLGGAPELNTLEVSIYQFLRYDFNPLQAAGIACVQLLLTFIAAYLYWLTLEKTEYNLQTLTQEKNSYLVFSENLYSTHQNKYQKYSYWLILIPYILFLCLPLLGILIDGIKGIFSKDIFTDSFLENSYISIITSLEIASLCGLLTAFFALLFARGCAILQFTRPRLASIFKNSLWFCMGISPTVLSFTWFLSLRSVTIIEGNPKFAVLFMHIVLALPLAIKILQNRLENTMQESRRQIQLLGINSFTSFWQIEFPAIQKQLLLALAIGFAFSFGEAGAVALFGGEDLQTIPLLIYRLMGSYHFSAAAVLSLLLAIICGGIFYLAERQNK